MLSNKPFNSLQIVLVAEEVTDSLVSVLEAATSFNSAQALLSTTTMMATLAAVWIGFSMFLFVKLNSARASDRDGVDDHDDLIVTTSTGLKRSDSSTQACDDVFEEQMRKQMLTYVFSILPKVFSDRPLALRMLQSS